MDRNAFLNSAVLRETSVCAGCSASYMLGHLLLPKVSEEFFKIFIALHRFDILHLKELSRNAVSSDKSIGRIYTEKQYQNSCTISKHLQCPGKIKLQITKFHSFAILALGFLDFAKMSLQSLNGSFFWKASYSSHGRDRTTIGLAGAKAPHVSNTLVEIVSNWEMAVWWGWSHMFNVFLKNPWV